MSVRADGAERERHTDKMTERKAQKRRQIMQSFVLAARKVLDEQGPGGLTIRKIGEMTDYSSAALYSYFADLQELQLYASLDFHRTYVEAAARAAAEGGTVLEQSRRIYAALCRHVFARPEICLNLYFGRHSHKLRECLEEYNRLFPWEYPPAAEQAAGGALQEPDLFRSSLKITETLSAAGEIVPEHKELAAKQLTWLLEGLLHRATEVPEPDIRERSGEFLQMFDHIIATN